MNIRKVLLSAGKPAILLAALLCAAAIAAHPCQAEEESKLLDVQEISEYPGVLSPGCAPAAAANVLGYWAKQGCPFFPLSADASLPQPTEVSTLLAVLGEHMDTDATGSTLASKIPFAIWRTLRDYHIKGSVTWPLCTFDNIKKEIDNNRPCIVGLAWHSDSLYYDHFVCVIGYYSDGNGYRALYVHDGLAPADFEVQVAWEPFFSGTWRKNPKGMIAIKPGCQEQTGSCCFYECADGTTNQGSGYATTQGTVDCQEYALEQCAGSDSFLGYSGIVDCKDCSSAACFAKWQDSH